MLVAKLIAVLKASGAGTPGRFCGIEREMVLEAQDDVCEGDADHRHREDGDEVCDPALLVIRVDADDLVRERSMGANDAAQPDSLALEHLDHVAADEPGANADGRVGDDRRDDVEDHQKRSGATRAMIR